MAKLICDRMQNLQMSSAREPNFFHYCYICNTQLNSCKQALLHCSGKRHRKKLIFVQQRKNNLTAASQLPAHHERSPMSPIFHSVSGYPVLQSGPPYLGPMGMATPDGLAPGGMFVGHPVHHAASVPSFFPVQLNSGGVPMLSGNSTADWCQQQRSFLYSGSQQGNQFGVAPPPMPMAYGPNSHLHPQRAPPPTLNFAGTSIPSAFALGFPYSSGSSSSSPMVMTDTSYGSGASDSCQSSAIISPSETSSITSETQSRKLHKCHVCQRQCSTAAQLHAHLQNAKHFRPSLNYSDGEHANLKSEPEDNVEDVAEAGALRATVRSLNQRVHTHSRSSSTSSEPADLIMDSGYTSGSGDEIIVCVSPPTEEKPIAKFRCQLCNIFLNSPLQAKQHIASQRHRINLNVVGTFVPVDHNETGSVQNFSAVGRPSFRRRGNGSLKKRPANAANEQQPSNQPVNDSSTNESPPT